MLTSLIFGAQSRLETEDADMEEAKGNVQRRMSCAKCGAKLRMANPGPYCSPCGDMVRRIDISRKALGLPLDDEDKKD